MIKRQEEEDRLKRIKRHEMALTYQRELDQQVREVRQRSFDSLTSKHIATYIRILLPFYALYIFSSFRNHE
ncbi:hypothetical protein EON65_32695 [archaeon]|nr:MAG: hypothetical protein EON65_32695 [archaeon]